MSGEAPSFLRRLVTSPSAHWRDVPAWNFVLSFGSLAVTLYWLDAGVLSLGRGRLTVRAAEHPFAFYGITAAFVALAIWLLVLAVRGMRRQARLDAP